MFSSNQHNGGQGNNSEQVHTGARKCEMVLQSGATQKTEKTFCTAESGHGSVHAATWGDVSTLEQTGDTKFTADPG